MKASTEEILKLIRYSLLIHNLTLLDENDDMESKSISAELENESCPVKVRIEPSEAGIDLSIESKRSIPEDSYDRILDLLNTLIEHSYFFCSLSIPSERDCIVAKTSIPVPDGHFDFAHFEGTFRMTVQLVHAVSDIVRSALSSDMTVDEIISALFTSQDSPSSEAQTH